LSSLTKKSKAMETSVNSDKIKQLRVEKSWSQEKLSLASGLSLRTIQRIENEGVCSLESRQAIAATFQVIPSSLGIGEGASNFLSQDLSDSKYEDINFSNAEFTNSNMINAKFTNLNMRKVKIHDVNLSLASFDDVNLSKVEITDANISGMKIFGYLVSDLIEHYEKTKKST